MDYIKHAKKANWPDAVKSIHENFWETDERAEKLSELIFEYGMPIKLIFSREVFVDGKALSFLGLFLAEKYIKAGEKEKAERELKGAIIYCPSRYINKKTGETRYLKRESIEMLMSLKENMTFMEKVKRTWEEVKDAINTVSYRPQINTETKNKICKNIAKAMNDFINKIKPGQTNSIKENLEEIQKEISEYLA